MTKKRERYTERNRPTRGGTGGATAGPKTGLDPIVVVSIAGLALAVVLAIGFLFGRGGGDQQAADAPTAEPTIEGALDADSGAPAEGDTGAMGTVEMPDAADDGSDAGEGASDAAGDDAGDDGAGGASSADVIARANAYPDGPDDMALDPENTAYFVTVETEVGPIEIELWPAFAPETVNAFAFLIREGFYDGMVFHRVEPGFVIQGGDPLGSGGGGPGYTLPGEFNTESPVPHSKGSVAMARTDDPNSAGSQWYIVLADGAAGHLDGQYTVFAHVVSGMENALKVTPGTKMTSVTLVEEPIAESLVSPDAVRDGTGPAND